MGPIDRTVEVMIAATGPDNTGGTVTPVGFVFVDWGDATQVESVELQAEETDDLTFEHTYASAGDYDIQIYTSLATIVLGHGGSATGLLGPANSRQAIKATAITIGDGVTGIDAYGLSGMWGCKSIYIPDGVTLGDYAMRQCYSLEAVRLPSDLLEIPSRCFYGCATLQSVVIPETVTVIGNSAFYDCAGLKSVDIPDGVIDIGASAFYGCTSLRSFVFPAGVTELPSSCFRTCYALNALTLSPNTTNIGGYAIYGIDALGSLEIPATVTRMSDYAVHSANGLRWLRMRPTTPPTTSQYTFSSFSSRCKIIVPDGSGEAYKTATRWKTYASRIFEESEVAW